MSYVRNPKSRLLAYMLAAVSFVIIVYLLQGSQQQLDDSRRALASCNQQTESLSAQLQVIFEYKLRLEKSLQKEKTEHKQTREDCQTQANQEKDERDKELLEAANKYSALQQSISLLQSKQKDLEDENRKLRKETLKLAEEMEVQKKQLTSKLTEEQQLRMMKEKAIENVKSKNLELEVKYNKAVEDSEQLKKQLPESSRIQALEKEKFQLEHELETAKTKLQTCTVEYKQEKKVSQPGVGDNPSGVEPPKLFLFNKVGTNASTTPVINPEAVIDHDVSSPKPALNETNKATPAGGSINKPTQAAAAPIQNPLKQVENPNDFEVNRQIPMPNNLEPHPQQSPENTVIKKPELANAPKSKDELAEENQGGEVGHNAMVGPLNPIQDPVAPPPQNQEGQAAKNKVLNAIQWEEEGPQNGAHEEGEEEAAPKGWRGGEEVDNKVLPRHMNHDYHGLEYDKDNQEEEEDEEGEQMDYLGGDTALKHRKQMAKLRQFDRNADRGGGVMLSPK